MAVAAGTLSKFHFQVSLTEDAPHELRVTVFREATATGVTCKVSGATSCSDTTHTATFAAGEKLSIKIEAKSSLDEPHSGGVAWWATFE